MTILAVQDDIPGNVSYHRVRLKIPVRIIRRVDKQIVSVQMAQIFFSVRCEIIDDLESLSSMKIIVLAEVNPVPRGGIRCDLEGLTYGIVISKISKHEIGRVFPERVDSLLSQPIPNDPEHIVNPGVPERLDERMETTVDQSGLTQVKGPLVRNIPQRHVQRIHVLTNPEDDMIFHFLTLDGVPQTCSENIRG